MLTRAEVLTPESSDLCLQAQTALTRLGSAFCANSNEYRSSSGTAHKECSIKHLQCCWAFLEISYCLFLLPSSWSKSCRAKRDMRWVNSIQPLWRLTCENGHQLMMIFQKQNKSALFWVKFVQWTQKVHNENHGHRLCSSVLEHVEKLVRQLNNTFWKSLLYLTPLPRWTLAESWFGG